MFSKPLAIGCGVLASISGVLGWWLLAAHEDLGAAKLALANASKVIAAKEADARLSAAEIDQLHARTIELASKTAPVRERIVNVPTAAVDDPAIGAAAAGVRALLAAPGGPPARR